MTHTGFPHSDISGSYACTRLTGTFRSVPRPSSAPYAKASPIYSYSLYPCDTEKLILSRYFTYAFRYLIVKLHPVSSTGFQPQTLRLCPQANPRPRLPSRCHHRQKQPGIRAAFKRTDCFTVKNLFSFRLHPSVCSSDRQLSQFLNSSSG